jgi:hypothetical protein
LEHPVSSTARENALRFHKPRFKYDYSEWRGRIEPCHVLTDQGSDTARRAMGAAHLSHDPGLRLVQWLTS